MGEGSGFWQRAAPAKLAALGRLARRWFMSYIFLSLAGLAVGYGIFVAFVHQPKIAVINVVYAELYGYTADQIAEVLKYVGQDKSIRAVVIKLNSPGGSIRASADVLMNTIKLREKKPVVVLVTDMAASGGYMWLLGANYVYANPGSVVGNIGAIMYLPEDVRPEEEIVATGPFKMSGNPRRTYIAMLELVKEAFVQSVVSQRGDRLRISTDEIVQGRIYLGFEAARLGLVDALGTESEALQKAASLAGVRRYRVVDVNEEMEKRGVTLYFGRYDTYSSQSVKVQFPYIHYVFWEPK